MKTLPYDLKKYNFPKLVEDLFPVPLMDLDNDNTKTGLVLGHDTHTAFHKVFYKRLDAGWPEFDNVYESFVREVIFPLFEDDTLIYQSSPGIRFNRPGAKAVYKWHSDGDSDHKHPLGEINVFVPLTPCSDTNAMWVESIPGLGDFEPANLKVGEFLLGYLNQQRHGNFTNQTGKTRVSFDFRVIPGFAYDDKCSLVSCTTKTPFLVGGYYSQMERDPTPDTFDILKNKSLEAAC